MTPEDELNELQAEMLQDTKERLAACEARDTDELIRLFRALDLAMEASIQEQEDEFDLADHIDDDFKATLGDGLDYGHVHIELTGERDFEIERVQDTDLESFTSGLKFVAPDGTVVAEPGSEVDMEGV